MTKTFCPHGHDVTLYVCPDCDHERSKQRRRRADRARFKAQRQRILGTLRRATSPAQPR